MDGQYVLYFQKLKKKLKKNDIFLTINSGRSSDRGSFIICDNRYRTKWRSLITVDGDSPIGIFDSLQEVRAFAIGLLVGKNKIWK